MAPSVPIQISLFPLARRLGTAAALLLGEGLTASLFFDSNQVFGWAGRRMADQLGAAALWTAHLLIGFATIFAAFVYLQRRSLLDRLQRDVAFESLPIAALIGNIASFLLFLGLSSLLARNNADGVLIVPWLASGVALVSFAGLAALPLRLWRSTFHETGRLPLYAFLGAAAASSLVKLSGRLWEPMRGLTFRAVELVLRPILPVLIVDPAHMRIGSNRCTAIISQECSGLEGVALLLIFLSIWLLVFRNEIRFPQALVLVPVGIALLLSTNVLRIAGLILIGHAGYRNIAAQGFHSEAGWILFNAVAFGIVIGARKISFFSKFPKSRRDAAKPLAEDRTAAYLCPFLALLAAGMVSQAASGGFEWAYGLRTLAVALCLWWLRRDTPALRMHLGAGTIAVGFGVYALWIAASRVLPWDPHFAAFPMTLAALPAAQRYGWILIRIVTAVILVPVVEELAFRGFLLRRLTSERWEKLDPVAASWFAIVISSGAFAALHGSRWLEAFLAGVAYAWIYRKRGDLSEAVTAHAITNALLVVHVLIFGDWSLW